MTRQIARKAKGKKDGEEESEFLDLSPPAQPSGSSLETDISAAAPVHPVTAIGDTVPSQNIVTETVASAIAPVATRVLRSGKHKAEHLPEEHEDAVGDTSGPNTEANLAMDTIHVCDVDGDQAWDSESGPELTEYSDCALDGDRSEALKSDSRTFASRIALTASQLAVEQHSSGLEFLDGHPLDFARYISTVNEYVFDKRGSVPVGVVDGGSRNPRSNHHSEENRCCALPPMLAESKWAITWAAPQRRSCQVMETSSPARSVVSLTMVVPVFPGAGLSGKIQ
ncbi:hypothetical protein NLG97_g721 [Lecanicillium saksenae]|uniref:Uncharacterized protein n=1 Tax=Lecanicillium saksenae TaxID=468837 RepID=A0ACC1R7P3_9HYPO|nr:hypothetical protein NLG97_g721 [Lecanicillium saksenae]